MKNLFSHISVVSNNSFIYKQEKSLKQKYFSKDPFEKKENFKGDEKEIVQKLINEEFKKFHEKYPNSETKEKLKEYIQKSAEDDPNTKPDYKELKSVIATFESFLTKKFLEKSNKNTEITPENIKNKKNTEIFDWVTNPKNKEAAFKLFFTPLGANKYQVNFHGVNEHLLGMGHFSFFCEKFPQARVNQVLGKRSAPENKEKPGYYNQKGRLVIYSGDMVEGILPQTETERKQNSDEYQVFQKTAKRKNKEYRKKINLSDKLQEEYNNFLGPEYNHLPKKQKFLLSTMTLALKIEKEYKIPAVVCIAQCLLESGNGESTAFAMNFFGIKAYDDWNGKVSEGVLTHEDREGKDNNPEFADFRAYGSMTHSFDNYGEFLQGKRYSEAFQHTDNPKQFAHSIWKSGYATSTEYISHLENRLNRFGFDWNSDIPSELEKRKKMYLETPSKFSKNPDILEGQCTKEEAYLKLGIGGENFGIRSTGNDFKNRRNRKATTLEGIRMGTLNGMQHLQRIIGKKFIITGGTEDGHSGGLNSQKKNHGNGYKIDISFEGGIKKDLKKFLKEKDPLPKKIPGYGKQYHFTSGNYTYKIIQEKDHFDIAVL